jgi:sugar phosphate isomerase/epimerase
LADYAEKWNVKLGMEVHAPMEIETLGKQIEIVKRLNTPYVGFVPDCGAFCRAPADIYTQRFLGQGVPQALMDKIAALWRQRVSEPEMRAEIKALGGGELAELAVTESHIYFGHSDPHRLRDILPYIVHVHGKFFNMENGEESAVRLPEIVQTLQEGGYAHSMSCEYEGHHWLSPKSALEQLRAHQAAIRKIFEANA